MPVGIFPFDPQMDKSPRYIALCKRSDEIQRRWVQSYGDFYLDENGRLSCWLEDPERRQRRRMKKGFAICSQDGVIRLSKYFWMPRQNQLIEMAQIRGRTYDSVSLDFYNWTKTGYDREARLPGKIFLSMEQIWLAYVMQRKFLKKCDGSDWTRLKLGQPG